MRKPVLLWRFLHSRQDAENRLFDLVFFGIRQLESGAGKNLDAVIFKWIVRRGNHHARRILAGAREICNTGSGQHSGAGYLDTGSIHAALQPVGQLRRNGRPRFARVHPDQYRQMRQFLMLQILRQCHAQRRYSKRVEWSLSRGSTDTIRAKEPFCHVECYRVRSSRIFTVTRGAPTNRSWGSSTYVDSCCAWSEETSPVRRERSNGSVTAFRASSTRLSGPVTTSS